MNTLPFHQQSNDRLISLFNFFFKFSAHDDASFRFFINFLHFVQTLVCLIGKPKVGEVPIKDQIMPGTYKMRSTNIFYNIELCM